MASKRLVVVVFLLVCKTGQGDPTSAPAAEEAGAGDASFPISVGVLLPENTPVIEYPYALSRVVPGVRIALESLRFKELLPNVSIDFRALDSECSSTWTPLRAMELMVSPNARPVDLLLGPACDLAASPVARYNTQWKTNIVTAGCGAFAYRDKNATLLTRVLLNYESSGQAVGRALSQMFNWRVIVMMTEVPPDSSAKGKECYFTNSGIGIYFRDQLSSRPSNINMNPSNENYTAKLLEVTMQARGKSVIYNLSPCKIY